MYDLLFRIDSAAGREGNPGGKVKVGTRIRRAPSRRSRPLRTGPWPRRIRRRAPFLKEQQWKTEFATLWVREGMVRKSVRGPARVQPAGGGEVVFTAPVDAMVASPPWPYTGLAVARGGAVFRLIPSVEPARSLSELGGEVGALQAEAAAAPARATRLEGLLKVEAVSRAEVERAQAAAQALEARLRAAREDLGSATAARTGRGGGHRSWSALRGAASSHPSTCRRGRPSRPERCSAGW